MTHDSPRYYWLNEMRMDEEFPLLEMVPVQRESPKRNPERTQRFIETITRRLKQRYPHWEPGTYCNLQSESNHVIRFEPDEFPAEVEYDGPAPGSLTHYELITVPGSNLNFVGHRATFLCASRAWADAIAACEPGVHELHPIKLIFADGVEIDRVIIRTMQADAYVDFETSDVHGDYEMHGCDPKIKVSAFRSLLHGKHWVRQHGRKPSARHELVFLMSGELLERLRPLVPDRLDIHAVELI